ncbi:NEK2 protein, putative, partial [Perkinsus marinus ATCC 50983]
VKGKKTPSRVYKIGDREVVEEKPLSEGGFAYVSLMRDVNSSQTFAMKKMKCTDRTRYQMALHECKILESLSGQPNIVNCYGHITEPGEQPGSQEVSLLLEYCDGGHLLDLLDRHKGILPTATIVKVMKDLMSAVNILHTQSPPIQHRDLKVENVLYKTASDSYLLCDFGSATTREYPHPSALSKSQMATLDEDIQRYTTLMYRSPEMVDLYTHLPITTQSDIWMCGCILFTLICYRHPFQDQSVLAISNAKYHIDAKASERHPRPLTDLCRWMLSRDPTRRPTAKQ